MMAIVQNSFTNCASSIMVGKIQGVIVDVLMPPMSAAELVLAYALGGVTRGLAVGASVAVSMSFFAPMEIMHVWAIIFFSVAGALALSLAGVIAGIWAEKFDRMAVIQNFFITPLAFLSGTFYSVERLPGIWRTLSRIDPFFYMIDGFRYGFIGRSDASPLVGVIVMIGVIAGLAFTAYQMFARGYKIKS
jgi:ABC-2 type transport system permease protein